jgi:DNA polymerase-3 subunit epsilon/ATP-dependent DNA helicase DinG
LNKIYIALDTETTGLKSEDDALIEVAAVKFRGEQVLDSWSSLVNPNRELPLKVERLTGITRSELRNAPPARVVARHLARFIGELPIVGHNIAFDMGFLHQQNVLLANPTIDTDELARIVVPHAARFSLKKLAEELNIPLPEHHRALADAKATMALFLALCGRATQLDVNTLNQITRAAKQSQWALYEVFQDVLHDATRSAFIGNSIGEQLRAKGLIKNNRLVALDDAVEKAWPALKPSAYHKAVDVKALDALFAEQGLLAKHFPAFEKRPQQVRMMEAAARAFNDKTHLLVEAGTGVGKSMAYLVPAIYFAVANERPVVVSTNTINLQDQLIEKDIPMLRKILTMEFRATVMKGRSNYLCRQRFEQFQNKPNKSPFEARLLAKILAWLPTTTTGDRAELSLSYDEETIWNEVCANETCNANSCRYYEDGTCFLYRARQRAEGSHLIVVNHALLLADMAVQNHLLPDYLHLVIDEAHHLEARATEALSFEATHSKIEALYEELAGNRGGLLGGIVTATRSSAAPLETQEDLIELTTAANEANDRAQREAYPFFNQLATFLRQRHSPRGDYDEQVRLTKAYRAQPAWSTIEILCEALTNALSRLDEWLSKIHRLCSDHEILTGDALQFELNAVRQRVSELRANLIAIVSEPSDNGIYWATVHARKDDVTLSAAPLHVGELLQKNIFSPKETVILTSATLQSAGGFKYVRERLGLNPPLKNTNTLREFVTDELALDSPFDYKKSTLLYLPTDVPEPDNPNFAKFAHETIIETCKATQGRALILFTSKAQLLRTYDAISKPLEQAGVLVIGQYVDGSRRQILENFKTMERCVLLGTRSFWEGVDVVGDALSLLIITRLPFAVPTDPIIAARSETFKDAFTEYQVPQAILSFRQGFGRLIRSATDRGVVVMLDCRVASKGYGKLFLSALPSCAEQRGKCKDVAAAAAAWLR